MSSTFQINIPRHRKHGYCHHESYGKCKFTSIFWKSIRPFFVEFRSKISQCWSSIVVSGWQQNQWTLRKNFWCWHWHSWSRKLGQQWSKRNSVKSPDKNNWCYFFKGENYQRNFFWDFKWIVALLGMWRALVRF